MCPASCLEVDVRLSGLQGCTGGRLVERRSSFGDHYAGQGKGSEGPKQLDCWWLVSGKPSSWESQSCIRFLIPSFLPCSPSSMALDSSPAMNHMLGHLGQDILHARSHPIPNKSPAMDPKKGQHQVIGGFAWSAHQQGQKAPCTSPGVYKHIAFVVRGDLVGGKGIPDKSPSLIPPGVPGEASCCGLNLHHQSRCSHLLHLQRSRNDSSICSLENRPLIPLLTEL